MRRRAVNLEARRGGEPEVWLIAHLDTKSQPVPLLVRAAGIAASAVVWPVTAVLALLAARGAVPYFSVSVAAIIGALAALPLVLSTVGDDSPGALDNASGVAAVIGATDLIGADMPIGVVITSAEELGMAGAAAWARGRPVGVAINCDGVDDDGGVTFTIASRSRWQPHQGVRCGGRGRSWPREDQKVGSRSIVRCGRARSGGLGRRDREQRDGSIALARSYAV